MTIPLEQPKTNLPMMERQKFIRIESARLTARAAYNAYTRGWQILPSPAIKTNGRTTENSTSPASGVRVAYARQITYGGVLEVTLYESDLGQALNKSSYAEQCDFRDMTQSQRFASPTILRMWEQLAVTACKYIRHT
jgi:hypothetical protein